VETAGISYRVADFLTKHPPFTTMAEEDLLAFAAHGRVRFHEPNEYLLWQGEPHRFQIFVIQQGTVSLWDDTGAAAALRDVRGAGDMIGVERFNGAPTTPYSARSESDVVVYAFPADDLETLLAKYPRARQYVTAEGRLTIDEHAAGERRDLTTAFLQQLIAHKALAKCPPLTSIRDAAQRLLVAGTDTLAVVDDGDRPLGVLTAAAFLEWVAHGALDPQAPVQTLVTTAPVVISPTATVADGILAMGAARTEVLAITGDGTTAGQLSATVSARDLGAVFGEQPAALLADIGAAASAQALRVVNHRVRAFAVRHLSSAASVDWLSRFTHLADTAIVRRLVALAQAEYLPACWCFCGSSGRSESLTLLAPQIVLIVGDAGALTKAQQALRHVITLLAECDYLPRVNLPFEPDFYAATLEQWQHRFSGWIGDPVRQQMYRARTLFDLRPIHGPTGLWQQIETLVSASVDADFLHVIANDCLATLPPLTFFADAVVDESGEQSSVFHLEETALRPLVDVARIFGLAARNALGRSTIERFAIARALLPEQQALLREAADTFRVVLWQQGRIGITQGTSGVDLPPSLLSRHDRHILKSGFRSILRLLQFTANPAWIATL